MQNRVGGQNWVIKVGEGKKLQSEGDRERAPRKERTREQNILPAHAEKPQGET